MERGGGEVVPYATLLIRISKGLTMTTQTAITEKFVEMSHGKTRYWEAGSGYPTILIHGAGWNSGRRELARWRWGRCRSSLRVLAIDCLNWGTGDVLDQEFSFAYLVDHVREFMDVLGIEQANVVGHSMGGWILTLLSYESPERVRQARQRRWRRRGDAAAAEHGRVQGAAAGADPRALQAAGARRRAGSFIGRTSWLRHSSQARPARSSREAFAKVMKHMTNPITRQRYNTLRRLPHINVPTLVLWGDEDATNDVSMAHELNDGIKGSKLVVFEGIGHGVPQEAPDQFVKALNAFL